MRVRVSRRSRVMGMALKGGRLALGDGGQIQCAACQRVLVELPVNKKGQVLFVGRRRVSHRCKRRAA